MHTDACVANVTLKMKKYNHLSFITIRTLPSNVREVERLSDDN